MSMELEGTEHHFEPFEVSAPHVIYVALGLFIVVFGMFSMLIKEKLYLGEAPLAMLFGIIIGPVAATIFDPASWGNQKSLTPGDETTNEITLEVTRVCIALSVFAVGVELPKKYVWRHWKSIAMLLGPVMVWSWIISSLLIWALIPGLDFLNSLMIGACLSPTDPILAQAVVGGPWAERHVPAHIRHVLQCESGCNDGAAFPFLFLAYYLTVNRGQVGFPVGKWFYQTWAWEICLGTFLGAMMGFLARRLIRFSERKKLVDRESFVAQYVSLALASMGVNVLLGSDDLLAAFACGSAFAWDGWFQKQTEDSNFSSIIDLLFNIGTFVYIGAIMPWHDFVNSEINLSIWRLIVLAILILLLKRIPIVVALWKFIPDIKTFHEAVFSGYFGPMGVGAIFMSTYGRLLLIQHVEYPPQTTNDVLAFTIQPIVFFLVLASVVVHGFTVPFFAFGKRAHVNLSRTLSMAPSYAFSIDEPGWVTSLRRTMTGATGHAPPEEEPTGQTSVVEAMHQGLRRLREPSVSTDEESQHGTIPEVSSLRKSEVEELGTEEDRVVPANDEEDWGGEDTAEMRKYRRKKAMERRAAEKEHGADDEKDIADMAYDDTDENKYPRVKQWLEGHSMVLEYQEQPLSEAKTVVIPISDNDYRALREQNRPFHAWLARHSDKLENYFGWDEDHPLEESHMSQLFSKGIPHQISKYMTDWLGAKKSDPSEIQAQPEFGNYTQDQCLGKGTRTHSSLIQETPTEGSSGTNGTNDTNDTDRTVGNNAPGTIISVPPPNTWRSATNTYTSIETDKSAPSDEPYDSGILRSHDTSSPEERNEGTDSGAESDATDLNVPRVSFAAYRPPGVTKEEAEAESNASS